MTINSSKAHLKVIIIIRVEKFEHWMSPFETQKNASWTIRLFAKVIEVNAI